MKQNNDLKVYAIVITETGDILTCSSLTEYAKLHPEINFYQYVSTKKIYNKIGHAKSGLAALDIRLQSLCSIAELGVSKIILDGKDVIKDRIVRKTERMSAHAKASEERAAKWQDHLKVEQERIDANRSKMFS